jgi:hypothetical protein
MADRRDAVAWIALGIAGLALIVSGVHGWRPRHHYRDRLTDSQATNSDAAKRAGDECEAQGIHNGYPGTLEARAFKECYLPLYRKYAGQ